MTSVTNYKLFYFLLMKLYDLIFPHNFKFSSIQTYISYDSFTRTPMNVTATTHEAFIA